jgi:hypothetical protein
VRHIDQVGQLYAALEVNRPGVSKLYKLIFIALNGWTWEKHLFVAVFLANLEHIVAKLHHAACSSP